MDESDPVAAALARAIKGGDVAALRRLLADHPGLASEPIRDRKGGMRTPLHLVADWPGYFPAGPAMAGILIEAGADPNARTGAGHPEAPPHSETPPRSETPLHWAASSDDADVADALITGGADVEAPGGSIGSPLDNAIGYGCWNVARLLVQRGARVDKLWHAAALGMLPRVEELLAADPVPEDITEAFWQACHGGQRRAAERLLDRGADVTKSPGYAGETPAGIAAQLDTRRENLVTWLQERIATPQRPD